MTRSCGIIAFRKTGNGLEFLVGHPGGEFWQGKDFWTLFKGCQSDGEPDRKTAVREFGEETGYRLCDDEVNRMFYLGEVQQNKKKVVCAYALYLPGIDPEKCSSNVIEDGVTPEIDKYAWMTYDEIVKRTHPKHIPLYDNLVKTLSNG